uniref:Uncharacterized protein n=1 Tax=Rhizophora mucronata TaxID=61149 RepID=A0A2P2R2X7_RHIMU
MYQKKEANKRLGHFTTKTKMLLQFTS